MEKKRETLKPVDTEDRPLRRRLGLREEFAMAVLPALAVLAMLGLVELLAQQRVLFASLAGSAFLIYHDPRHQMNTVRTLIFGHLVALCVGLLTSWTLGNSYAAAATAIVACISLMILLDAVHPPAISTSAIFAFRTGAEDNVALFGLAMGVLVGLVILQRTALWALARLEG